MQKIKIDFLPALDSLNLDEAGNYLEKNSTANYINNVNWPANYPYKPESEFCIARNSDAFLIHFTVKEKYVKATYLNDQEDVWQDSCVEFFVNIPGDAKYKNFEFNCIGTCLASSRKSRKEDVVPLSAEDMSKIQRHATLKKTAQDIHELTEWKLTVKIPFSVIGIKDITTIQELRANFYKCGDETPAPHYLSWNPIKTEQPDFHCPEFFGTIVL